MPFFVNRYIIQEPKIVYLFRCRSAAILNTRGCKRSIINYNFFITFFSLQAIVLLLWSGFKKCTYTAAGTIFTFCREISTPLKKKVFSYFSMHMPKIGHFLHFFAKKSLELQGYFKMAGPPRTNGFLKWGLLRAYLGLGFAFK